MMAETRGKLVLDDEGRLRVEGSPKYSDVVPVWPPGYELVVRNGEVRVLDGKGKVAARVGAGVYMGGGGAPNSLKGIRAVGEKTARELRERCPGRYWLVAPEVRETGRG